MIKNCEFAELMSCRGRADDAGVVSEYPRIRPARSACSSRPVPSFGRIVVLRERIAALDHGLVDAVKCRSVVNALLCEFFELLRPSLGAMFE